MDFSMNAKKLKHVLAFLLVSVSSLFVCIPCIAKDEDVEYKYELEFASTTNSQAGYVTFKVWSYGRREKLTRDICMRNAVHGLIFKGLDSSSTGLNGKEPAMCPEGYQAHAEYFDDFFRGDYLQFVQISSKGAIAAGDVIQIAKKEYKVGMTVKVNKEALRKRLEADGICESVHSIFSR